MASKALPSAKAASTYFENAKSFSIGTFNVSNENAADPVIKELCQNIASGALLNSKERSEAPKCHPDTRVAVQQDIFGWVEYNNHKATQPKKMLLLTGPAGSGKTTIMNTVGEQLRKRGNLAAAFFFSSFVGSVERSTKDRFVTTLAYQLILHNCLQDVREHVLSYIFKNPAILQMHLREQMEVLILEPLRNRPPDSRDASLPPEILLVDGLDECGQIPPDNCDQAERHASRAARERDQVEILEVLLDALKDPAFPFRLIIASRPEPAIMQFFSNSAKGHSADIFLDNKYNPDADIKLYLTSHFSRIRRRHTSLLPSWPGEDAIATLVDNASGQMIYAATVIRFVETSSNLPGVQLDFVLNSDIGSGTNLSNPFELLDILYAKILNSSPDPLLALKYLKAYDYTRARDIGMQPPLESAVICLCESARGEAEHLFANMAALVRVINPGSSYVDFVFYHKSFLDFLGDARRYRKFFTLEEDEVTQWIISRLVEVMERKRYAGSAVSEDVADSRGKLMRMWYRILEKRRSLAEWYDERLIACDPDFWINWYEWRAAVYSYRFEMLMFVISHNKCSPLLPCQRDCRRWRKPILAQWKRRGFAYMAGVGLFARLLDRFGFKRITPNV